MQPAPTHSISHVVAGRNTFPGWAGVHGPGIRRVCLVRTLKRRLAFHTALLHLKPLPKPICQIRSPRFMPENISWYASTYLGSGEGPAAGQVAGTAKAGGNAMQTGTRSSR
jgi:hypothetical protein